MKRCAQTRVLLALAVTSVLAVLPAHTGEDVSPPHATITDPQEYGVVIRGLSVVKGTATDDASGVADVLVEMRDLRGSFYPFFSNKGHATVSCGEGRTSCTWEIGFCCPTSSGSYIPPGRLSARATDVAGNKEARGQEITVIFVY